MVILSPDKTRELYSMFPLLYRGKIKPCTSSLMCLGFECRDGWYDIILELSHQIHNIFKVACLSKDDYPEVFQVKEKFGGLRFYIDPCVDTITDQIYKVVDDAEKKSINTCEICGNSGQQRYDGWVVTLCDSCNNKDNHK